MDATPTASSIPLADGHLLTAIFVDGPLEGFGAVEITEPEQSDQTRPVDGEHHPATVSIAARQPALNASERPGPTNAAPA